MQILSRSTLSEDYRIRERISRACARSVPGCGSLEPWSEDCELTSGCLQIYKLNGDAVLKDVEPGSARESAIVNELCVSSVALKLAA